MQVVEDPDGVPCECCRSDEDATIVRYLHSGERRSVPRTAVTPLDTISLRAIGGQVPTATAERLTPVRTDRALGFLAVLVHGGPRSVRSLLDATTLCESDLNGLVGDLRAAGLVTTATVGDMPGYEARSVVHAAFESP